MKPCDRKKICNLPGNDVCFDCGSFHPTWTSLSHGTLICMKCSGLHRGMGVHISFVRSLDLDSFSEEDVKKLFCGGNQTCRDFFAKHGVVVVSLDTSAVSSSSTPSSTSSTISTNQRGNLLLLQEQYNSKVAKLYRETLKARVQGKPEPEPTMMQDIPEQGKEDLCGTTSGSTTTSATTTATSTRKYNHLVSKQQNENSSYHSATRKVSNVEYFIGGLKYWTSRYVLLPTSNNLAVVGLMLVTYISTKVIVKTSKVLEWSNSCSLVIYAMDRLFFIMFISMAVIIFVLSCLSIKWFQVHRQDAFKSAVNSFQDRVMHARAKRNPLYDLYFPPQTSVGSNVSKAIIFFPDVLVDKTAYAFVLGKISDCGILVAAVNLDPMRLSGVVANKSSPGTIVSKISFEIRQLLGINVEEWILMSHGEGACAVSHVMKVLSAQMGNAAKQHILLPRPPTRCILWSPTLFMYDLRNLNISTLILYAVESSKEVSCERRHHDDDDDDEWICRKIRVPSKRSQMYKVVGGSHSGFAHYGPATFRKDNVKRVKSLDDQQNEVRDVCVDFVLKED